MNPYPFNTPQVRDLAWACFTPPLLHSSELAAAAGDVDNCGLTLTPQREAWLAALDRNPAPLIAHLARKRSHRLGIYFESLWHFFLSQDQDVALIAHNLPVRAGGKTLGEFDCLYYCHQRQRHFHLELAVKFFLSNRLSTKNESHSHWQEWWGPECQDRLDLKINHLMQRQIRLSQRDEAHAVLAEAGINEAPELEVEIKGYLFQSLGDPLQPPTGYNALNRVSRWAHQKDLADMVLACDADTFVPLDKLRWLAPMQLPPGSTGLSSEQLADQLDMAGNHGLQPQLIAALDSEGYERCRFFVVPDNWPTGDGQRR